MTDTYQAVYDAVRSRISYCDVGSIVQSSIHLDGSFAIDQVKTEFMLAARLMQEPSVLYKPALYPDEGQWCALYGENIQAGVAGFGDSPAEAMENFNKAWFAKIKHEAATMTDKTRQIMEDDLPPMVEEGLAYFDRAGDKGDKLYVKAIREYIASLQGEGNRNDNGQ